MKKKPNAVDAGDGDRLERLKQELAALRERVAFLETVPEIAHAVNSFRVSEKIRADEARAREREEQRREELRDKARPAIAAWAAARLVMIPGESAGMAALVEDFAAFTPETAKFASKLDGSDFDALIGDLDGVDVELVPAKGHHFRGATEWGARGLRLCAPGETPAETLAAQEAREADERSERESTRRLHKARSDAEAAAIDREIRRDEALARLAGLER